ncbi:hypothetical protein C8Q77DRAFT_21805 [Trametes polyzona]|nr:hypothetical protein C8Q77DRAFT_21805 [Trametes polyzona]
MNGSVRLGTGADVYCESAASSPRIGVALDDELVAEYTARLDGSKGNPLRYVYARHDVPAGEHTLRISTQDEARTPFDCSVVHTTTASQSPGSPTEPDRHHALLRREPQAEGPSEPDPGGKHSPHTSTLGTHFSILPVSFVSSTVAFSPTPSFPPSTERATSTPEPTSGGGVGSSTVSAIRSNTLAIVLGVVLGVLVLAALVGLAVSWRQRRKRKHVAPSTEYLRSVAAAAADEDREVGLGGGAGAGPGIASGAGAGMMRMPGPGVGRDSPVSVASQQYFRWTANMAGESPTTPVSTLNTLEPLRPSSLGVQTGK